MLLHLLANQCLQLLNSVWWDEREENGREQLQETIRLIADFRYIKSPIAQKAPGDLVPVSNHVAAVWHKKEKHSETSVGIKSKVE